MVLAFRHALIPSLAETSRRQILVSVTAQFAQGRDQSDSGVWFNVQQCAEKRAGKAPDYPSYNPLPYRDTFGNISRPKDYRPNTTPNLHKPRALLSLAACRQQ